MSTGKKIISKRPRYRSILFLTISLSYFYVIIVLGKIWLADIIGHSQYLILRKYNLSLHVMYNWDQPNKY